MIIQTALGCSRLLSRLDIMSSGGVQSLPHQRNELIQRVRRQESCLHSSSIIGLRGMTFTAHQPRYTMPMVRLVLGLSLTYFLIDCSGFFNLEELPHNDINDENWNVAATSGQNEDFNNESLENALLLSASSGWYNFVETYIGRHEWSEEFMDKFVLCAVENEQGYDSIKILIDTGKLSPRKLIHHAGCDPLACAREQFSYSGYDDSLIYTVLSKASKSGKKISQETWDFVQYLLEKGESFYALETGLMNRSTQRTTGEKCLEMFLDWNHDVDACERLIEMTGGNLGPRALFILEQKRDDYLKQSIEREGKEGPLTELYLVNRSKLDKLIGIMSPRSGRVQDQS